MLTKEVKDLYSKFRKNPPFMRVGHNAADALNAARTIARFRELEADGKVRLRVEFDDDCDVSWMDEKQREDWDGEAYGTITEYLCESCGSWNHADSVWGHIGYRDVSSPFENCYVVDEMAEAISQYENQ